MNMETTFAVLSDIHLGSDEPKNTHKMFHYSQSILERAIGEMNSHRDIEFVLVAGDLTKNSEPFNHEAVKRILNQLRIPYYVVPGNHDVKKAEMPSENWGIEDFVRAYQGHGYSGDKSWYSLDPKPNVHLVGLDSASESRFAQSYGGALSLEQLDWLELDLAQARGKTTVVMIHHALIHHKGGSDPRYYVENADQVKDILKKYGVQIVTTGHLHITDIAVENGLFDISCPAICSYPCAYRILKLSENELFVNTIWHPSKTVREIAKAELLTRGTSEAGLKVTEGDASDRWAMLELRELARMMVLS